MFDLQWQGWFLGGGRGMLSPPPPPMLVNELVIFGQTLQFPPDLVIIGQKKKKRFVLIQKKKKLVQFVSLSYFVSIGHILSHLVKFVYFSLILLILCAIYGTFLVGQSSFLIGQSSTKSVKLVKIINAP